VRQAVVATIFALAGVDHGAQTPTFSISVDAVRLDVLVVDRGRPLSGLDVDDLELRDNGVRQRIRSVAQEETPLDAILVLDRSGSVAGEPLERLREAARTFVAELSHQDRAALVAFSHQVRRPARLTAELSAVQQALDRVAPSGATALFDAAYAALVLRARSPNRTMILVFSDGLDTASWMPPADVIEFGKQVDAVVYAIMFDADRRPRPPSLPLGLYGRGFPSSGTASDAVRSNNAPAFLQAITEATGGQLLRTHRDAQLRDLFLRALRDMKARYVVTYVPEGVERKGWHTIDVRLLRRKGTVTARRGYFVP
jgi:VWFA-related protein